MPEFDKELFWEQLKKGLIKKEEKPKPKKVEAVRPAAPVMRITGNCVLIVTTTKCNCGATYVAPNRLMIEFLSNDKKLRHMKPLPQGQYPSGYTREVREVHTRIDYCHQCFLTRGFEPQECETTSQENVVQLPLPLKA